MYCRKCEFCGANLDPGERCDCHERAKENKKKIESMLFTESDGQMVLKEALEYGIYTRI